MRIRLAPGFLVSLAAAAVAASTAGATTLSFTIANSPARQDSSPLAVAPIAPGFVGLSIDYCSLVFYNDGAAPNPVLLHLIAGLAPQRPVLRIGGLGPEAPCPNGESHSTLGTLRAISALTRRLNARLILGLNLQAQASAVARRETTLLLHAIDPGPRYRYITAFELGNEPDLYASYGSSTGFGQYIQDFLSWSRAVRAVTRDGSFGIAGPSLGVFGLPWITGADAANFTAFLYSGALPRLVTFHSYALIRYYGCPTPQTCPTIPNLLLDSNSHGLAAALAPFVTQIPSSSQIRDDEMNSITDQGLAGVSDTFTSALWALDTMFEMAAAGVDGINIHTFSSAAYSLFSQPQPGLWFVHPEYYGLLAFNLAAPTGSQMLTVGPQLAAAGGPNVKVWATEGLDRKTRVTLINKDPVAYDVTLSGPAVPAGRLSVMRLAGPGTPPAPGSPAALACPSAYVSTGLCATTGITLGGATFGPPISLPVQPGSVPFVITAPNGDRTATGQLAPRATDCSGRSGPSACLLIASAGTITVHVPAASAVIVIGATPAAESVLVRRRAIRNRPPRG